MQRRLQFVRDVGGEFLPELRCFFELCLTLPDHCLLLDHFPEQRGDLFVFFLTHVGPRRVRVDLVDRCGDLPGQADSQPVGEAQRQQDQQQDGLQKTEQQRPDGVLLVGEADDRAVREKPGGIQESL